MIMDLIVQLDLDLGSVPLYSQTTSISHGKQIYINEPGEIIP